MAAVIRLKRMGAIKKPAHRIVVMNRESARDSRPIETLGFYDPKTNPATIKVKRNAPSIGSAWERPLHRQ